MLSSILCNIRSTMPRVPRWRLSSENIDAVTSSERTLPNDNTLLTYLAPVPHVEIEVRSAGRVKGAQAK